MPVYRLSKAQVMVCGDISTIALRYSYAFPTILKCQPILVEKKRTRIPFAYPSHSVGIPFAYPGSPFGYAKGMAGGWVGAEKEQSGSCLGACWFTQIGRLFCAPRLFGTSQTIKWHEPND